MTMTGRNGMGFTAVARGAARSGAPHGFAGNVSPLSLIKCEDEPDAPRGAGLRASADRPPDAGGQLAGGLDL